jgi:hypothetical protein
MRVQPLFVALAFTLLFGGCAEQPPTVTSYEPPHIDGKVRSVSRAQLRAALDAVRKNAAKYQDPVVAFRSVYVWGANRIQVSYVTRDGVQIGAFVRRANGRWECYEPEREIVRGYNVPTGWSRMGLTRR